MDEKLKRLQQKLKTELGSTIVQALNDPLVVEIMLNSDGKLWIERHGSPMTQVGEMSALNAESLMGTIADSLGTVITRKSPILEGELPLDGSRFEGLIPPIVSKPTFTIRKKSSVLFTFEDYVDQNILTEGQHVFLEGKVKERSNILIVGGTSSGKTTFTNAVIDCISKTSPDDRLVIIEDTAEVQSNSKNTVFLRSSLEISMLQLLKATMRLRPDRILVGEVRGEEALALLKAWNTGHPGGVATIHANSALAGLVRLEQLISESGSSADMSPIIAEAVDVIIYINKTTGGRKVEEIIEVNGINKDGSYKVNLIKDKEENYAINNCSENLLLPI